VNWKRSLEYLGPESNRHTRKYRILNPARLPVPPPRHFAYYDFLINRISGCKVIVLFETPKFVKEFCLGYFRKSMYLYLFNLSSSFFRRMNFIFT
jgi:hypothetical protein